jgi:DNA primase
LDSDNAGQVAMKRAIRMALQNDISIKIISTAPFKDPDEAIKKDPKNFEKSIKLAKPALDYWINNLVQGRKLSVDEKKKIAKEILHEIKIIASDIEKQHYIKFLLKKLMLNRMPDKKCLRNQKKTGNSLAKKKKQKRSLNSKKKIISY